ncbi:nuclease-related domain-containing protein [Alicyclobacillus sp. ALC3]|uniref:nuclease-related domain-containing protein n=1 Tax=Alicyclobacillus sp. ALC3 TaxID=2796143 RepID=UPI002379EEB7|nr:nuclease-related domain-containing protein [Alicyclobacillus sp. ALC3]WDL97515.1 NERD domain-containing protein [Alicyclobacillus sp. ALC3]
MRNNRNRGPVSVVIALGLALVLSSYVAPLFVSLHTTVLWTDTWRFVRLVGWILIAVGVIRTGILRQRAQKVVKAKAVAGLRGEMETARVLTRLGAQYRVFNRIYVYHGGRRQEFDHIVVGPNGVFHVESKNWAGVIEVSDGGVGRSVDGGHHDAAEQMRRHHALLRALLYDHGLKPPIVGILCFTNRHAQVYGHHSAFEYVRVNELTSAISTHQVKQRLDKRSIDNVVRLITQNSEIHEV